MIWHIVKKDFSLLKGMVLLGIAAQIASALCVMTVGLQHTGVVATLFDFGKTLIALVNLGEMLILGLLILRVVQQDAPVGLRQDWLTRPISQAQMVAAKFVFVLLTIFLPMLLCNLVIAFTHGYDIGDVVFTAVSATLLSIVDFGLPVMIVGVIASSLTQAILIAITAGVLAAVATIALPGLGFGGFGYPALAVENQKWVKDIARDAVYLAGAGIVVALAYYGRRIWAARIAAAAALVLAVAAVALPFDVGFAIRQWTAPQQSLGDTVQLSYDAKLAPYESNGVERDIFRVIPIKVSGLPPHSRLHMEDMKLRVVAADGTTLYTAPKQFSIFGDFGQDGGFTLNPRNEEDHPASISKHQNFKIPADIYRQISGQPVRVVVDYSFSLMTKIASVQSPILFSRAQVDGLGICESHAGKNFSKLVNLSCYPAPEFSRCQVVTVVTGASRNKPYDACVFPNATPAFFSAPDRLLAGKNILAYRFDDGPSDPTAPLTEREAAGSQAIIDSYQPQAYIRRHYETPLLYLDSLKAISANRSLHLACRLTLWLTPDHGKETQSSRDIGLTIHNGGSLITVDAGAFTINRTGLAVRNGEKLLTADSHAFTVNQVGLFSPTKISAQITDSDVAGPFFGAPMREPGKLQLDRAKFHLTMAAQVTGGQAIADGECHPMGLR